MSAIAAKSTATGSVSSLRTRERRPRLPFDVVESKLGVPALRTGLVSRTALVNRLRATDSGPVVTIAAPAGYGKTTMLAQWASRDPRPFGWVSVDERDRDPIVLLRHIAAALDELDPLEPRVFEALADPGASMWTSALPRVGSALAAFPGPLVVVLDNAHLLRSRDALDAVTTLADHIPEGSLLVVAGRITPKLPIALLRASGRLLEVGVDQLALTPREGQVLLRSTGLELSFDEATDLVRECEGWAAALYLAAVAFRDADSPPGPIVLQPGTRNRNLTDYFRSEYLSRLRPAELQFLRRTSVLDELCGGLCDAVLGEQGSARELAKIERSNLFVVPLDHQGIWYRYHRLFRDVLRRELADREPKLVPALNRRAADWYEAHGDPESALAYARAAGDVGRVARIVTAIALPTYNGGRAAAVEGWLDGFDDAALLERHPALALRGSWIHALRGRSRDADRWLEAAEAGLARCKQSRAVAAERAWIDVVRAALCSHGVYRMIADAESALARAGREDPVRPHALLALGVGHVLLGQSERADGILAEAAAEAERLGAADTQVIAMSERSLIAAARDDVPTAERLALEARALVETSRLDGYATTAIALVATARASLRHGRWDEARADLAKVHDLSPTLGDGFLPWLALQTRIELARAYLALRETQAVRSLLGEIGGLLREHPDVGVLADEAELLARDVEALSTRGGDAAAALTTAELRLLPLLATHLSFREIGEQLFVSRNTIKTQAISVYRKLGVTSRSEAIECATRLGLVEIHPNAA